MQSSDFVIDTPIVKEGDWLVVKLADSAEVFGIRKPIKIVGSIDNEPYEGTLLPTGDGGHLMSIRAATRKKLGKGEGDTVTLRIEHYTG